MHESHKIWHGAYVYKAYKSRTKNIYEKTQIVKKTTYKKNRPVYSRALRIPCNARLN